MSRAVLYQPDQLPQAVTVELFSELYIDGVLYGAPELIAQLLGCKPELVDVLASGPEYVAYSIFDYEGQINYAAMVAVAEVSGMNFNHDDTDEQLCGPVLVFQLAAEPEQS